MYSCSSGCLEFPSKLGVSLQSSGELSFPGIPTGWQSPGKPQKAPGRQLGPRGGGPGLCRNSALRRGGYLPSHQPHAVGNQPGSDRTRPDILLLQAAAHTKALRMLNWRAESGFLLNHEGRGQLSTGSYSMTAHLRDTERGKA